jgi:hypothetical protein
MTRTDDALRLLDEMLDGYSLAERFGKEHRHVYVKADEALRALLTQEREQLPELLTVSGFVHPQYAAGWNACLARLARKEPT